MTFREYIESLMAGRADANEQVRVGFRKCREYGLTIRQIAEAAKVSSSTVNNYVRGAQHSAPHVDLDQEIPE